MTEQIPARPATTEARTYEITHVTRYLYDDDVTDSYGLFHKRPRQLPWQDVLSHEVTVSPEPDDLYRHDDVYGNTKTYFHVRTPHTELAITGRSRVVVRAGVLPPESLAVPWELAVPAVSTDPQAWSAQDFTFASPRVSLDPDARAYAARSFTPGRAVGEAAIELMHRVYEDFTYRSGSTTVHTRVEELMERRTGVCQDFSHVMVSGLRGLGLAACYVSGYLATRATEQGPRLVGADASHAWVGCWVPGGGWLYLDPTNNRLCDTSHATVAWGRDYGDVTPVKGVIFTEADKTTLEVRVDMAPRTTDDQDD